MESKNILIVESINDKYFVESTKDFLNNIDLEVDTPFCLIDDYECLEGLSLKSLTNNLHELKIQIDKKGIEKVGILLDADEGGIEEKINLINEALKDNDSTVKIEEVNKWYNCDVLNVDISCHILNVNGNGELETILKSIKSKDSIFADCLEAWQHCLTENGKSIDSKQFDKFWVSIYQRYDCCSRREQRQATRKCNNEASMKKDIWDYSHSSLSSFREFIEMFKLKNKN